MFTFEKGDYKYIFEYDTKEELQEYLDMMKLNIEEIEAVKNRHTIAHKIIEKETENPKEKERYNFFDLEVKFITDKKKLEKVGKRSYRAYESTFNKLKDFFKRENISDITIESFENFRDHLKNQKLSHTTINNHLTYVKMFVEFAKNRKLITEDNAHGVENLAESKTKKLKINYTDKEINEILAFEEYEKSYKDIFLIATHTGMRVNEIHSLTNDCIKQDEETGIYYFDIQKSKTTAGVRQVPIHKDILEKVLEMKFPLLLDKKNNEMTENGAEKAIIKQLYRIVKKDTGKVFHTFRGTFIARCLKTHPRDILIIQEIVGHAKAKDKQLTIDTYGNGFHMKIKKEIVDSVKY